MPTKAKLYYPSKSDGNTPTLRPLPPILIRESQSAKAALLLGIMYLRIPPIAFAALSAILVCASARATILNEYGNQSAWAAVTSGAVLQDFNGSGSTYSSSVAGIALASVNYRGFYNESTGGGYDTYRFIPGSSFDIGSGGIIIGGSNGITNTGTSQYDNGIRVNVSAISGIRSISFDYSGLRQSSSGGFPFIYSTAGTPIVLTFQLYEASAPTVVASTRNLTVASGSPVSSFYGFTSTGDISSIRILINSPAGTDQNRVILDNFALGQIAAGAPTGGPSALPEASTYLLCAAGLVGIGAIRRKRS